MIKRFLITIAVLVITPLAYLLFWPAPIDTDPVAWLAPPSPHGQGIFLENNILGQAALLTIKEGHGPEDTALGTDGRLYTGLVDGRIVSMEMDGSDQKVLATTGGRPLGVQFDKKGHLIIADANKGLLSLSPQGELTTLAHEFEGKPMLFVDDLDIARDGTIWFSDASQRFALKDNILDFMEGRPTGRLFSYNPKTRKVTMHGTGKLGFANGVALHPEGDYVLVNETMRYRIKRYWLKGEKAGTWDIFIENLPGFPDNISYNGKGMFWVALVVPRNKQLDEQLLPDPLAREFVTKLPRSWWPQLITPETAVLAVTLQGEPAHYYQSQNPKITNVTSVHERNGSLHVGSLTSPYIGILPLPQDAR